jgi:hypothetical protein
VVIGGIGERMFFDSWINLAAFHIQADWMNKYRLVYAKTDYLPWESKEPPY